MGVGLQLDSMWQSLVAALVPIVLGSLGAYFKPYIVPYPKFCSTIKLLRQKLLEQLAVKHAALLQHVREITPDELLRGDGREQPDLVGDLTGDTFRLFTIFHRLETLRLVYRSVHTVLLATVCLAIFGALAACLWVATRAGIPYAMCVLVAVQVCFYVLLYWSSCKLETYEDVT